MGIQPQFIGTPGQRGATGPAGPPGPAGGVAVGKFSTDAGAGGAGFAVTGGSFVNPTSAACTLTLGTGKSLLLSVNCDFITNAGSPTNTYAGWRVFNNTSSTVVYAPQQIDSARFRAVSGGGIDWSLAGTFLVNTGLGNVGDSVTVTPQFDLGTGASGFLLYISITAVSL